MSTNRLILLLLLVGFACRAFRLDAPQIPIFDEGLFYIPAAQAYLAGLPDPNFEHPPLGKLSIATGIGLLGDGPWGWRFPSVFAGTLGVALTYRFGRRLWGLPWAGLTAAGLLSMDFLWFEFSRLALLDIFQAVLLLLALNVAAPVMLSPQAKHLARGAPPHAPSFLRVIASTRPEWFLAGLVLGLAAAVKWSAVWVAPAYLIALWVRSTRREAGDKPPPYERSTEAIGERPRNPVAGTMAFLGGIGAGYALPWLYHIVVLGYGVADVVALHTRILGYQTQVGAGGVGATGLLLAPAWWLLNGPLVVTAREDRGVWMLIMSNTFVFWAGIVAVAFLAVRAVREPRLPAAFLCLAVLSLYLPWFGIARIKYFYYLLPAVPLLCLAIPGAWLSLRERLGTRSRFVATLYLVLAGAAFVGAYPALTAVWPR